MNFGLTLQLIKILLDRAMFPDNVCILPQLCVLLVLNINFLFSSPGEVDTRFSFCAIASLKLLVSPDTYYIVLYIVLSICLLIG